MPSAAPVRLRGNQPAGLPLVFTTGHRRLRALRARPATEARWPEGPVCDPCYRAALQHRGPCARCGQQRRLVVPSGPGADTCADCAQIPVFSACTDCGTEDKLYEKGRCARCSLRRRARDLLSAGTGIIPAQLSGVFNAVTAARQPRSALNWLRKGAGAGLLADVAAGRLAISHEALDVHPHRRAADYLRHMLTAAGALPARDEELARAGQWIITILEAIEPAAGRRLVQAYATWQVMRRLRASAAAAARPRTPTAHARNHIRAAASLLAWLRGRGTELAACGQADIDQWLRTGPSAYLARDFLAWAASRGHCQKLSIPAPPRATGPVISQDQRWALTARLLHDTALDPTNRVAGCLLLLYGQPLSRIAAMTTSQVTRHNGETFLRLGRHHVPVPGPLASAAESVKSNETSGCLRGLWWLVLLEAGCGRFVYPRLGRHLARPGAAVEPLGVGSAGGVKGGGAAGFDGGPGSVVHRRWGVHRDPGMPVLIIVVPEEVAAEYVDVFDGPEFAGERRAVLEGLEVRLRIRVIIGYVRAGMGLVDAEPRVQPGDGIRCHGGSAVGVDRLRRASSVSLEGVLDEFFREGPVLGRPGLPVNDFPGIDIDDDIQQVPYAPGGPFQFRDVPGPYLVRAVGHQLGFLLRRVGGLGAALPGLAALAQQPVHGGLRAQVDAAVQQDRVHLAGGLVGELRRVQHRENVHSLLF